MALFVGSYITSKLIRTYMIKTVTELKELLLWAKSEKIKSLKLGDMQVEFSDLGLIESVQDLSGPAQSPRLPNGNAQANEDEELLFYSSRS